MRVLPTAEAPAGPRRRAAREHQEPWRFSRQPEWAAGCETSAPTSPRPSAKSPLKLWRAEQSLCSGCRPLLGWETPQPREAGRHRCTQSISPEKGSHIHTGTAMPRSRSGPSAWKSSPSLHSYPGARVPSNKNNTTSIRWALTPCQETC